MSIFIYVEFNIYVVKYWLEEESFKNRCRWDDIAFGHNKGEVLKSKMNSFLDVNRDEDVSNINIDFWMKLNWISGKKRI